MSSNTTKHNGPSGKTTPAASTSSDTNAKLALSVGNVLALRQWEERQQAAGNVLYAGLGSAIFVLQAYPVIKDPEDPINYAALTEPQKFRWQEQVKLANRKREELEKAKANFFSAMYSDLSVDSLERVKQAAIQHYLQIEREEWEQEITRRIAARNQRRQRPSSSRDVDTDPNPEQDVFAPTESSEAWEVFQAAQDPLVLVRFIRKTHQSGVTSDPTEDRNRAIAKFESLRQTPKQTLDEFHLLWQETLKAQVATGQPSRSQPDLAQKFIGALDKTRWGTLAAKCANDANSWNPEIKDKAYPKTVDQAYLIARTWMVTASVETQRSGAPVSFVTTAATMKRPNKGSRRGKRDEKKTNEREEATETKTVSPKPAVEQKRKRTEITCDLCGEPHRVRECPHYEAVIKEHSKRLKKQAHLTVASPEPKPSRSDTRSVMSLATTTGVEGDEELCLDSQSNIHVFRDRRQLREVRTADTPVSIGGIVAGTRLECAECGSFEGIQEVYVHPEAQKNILSLALLENHYPITWEQGKFEVYLPHRTLTFERDDDRYVMRLDVPDRAAYIATVRERESRYPTRDLRGAKAAMELISRLCYPSEEGLVRALKAGNLDNPGVTVEDVRRAHAIYGPFPHVLKGKKTAQQPSGRLHEERTTFPTAATRNGILEVDIMHIDGCMALIAVLEEEPITFVAFLGSRSEKAIHSGLEDLQQNCAKYGWNVTFRMDNESGAQAIVNRLRFKDLHIEFVGSGAHVPRAERKIRVIKERCRIIINRLPFRAPRWMLKWIIGAVVKALNSLRDDSASNAPDDLRSPFERFTGRRVDARKDLKIAFGEYVEIPVTDNPTPNNMKPRTRGAIAIGPVGNAAGSVYFWVITTNRIVKRDSWTVCPMSDDVIESINKEAVRVGAAQSDPPEDDEETVALAGEVEAPADRHNSPEDATGTLPQATKSDTLVPDVGGATTEVPTTMDAVTAAEAAVDSAALEYTPEEPSALAEVATEPLPTVALEPYLPARANRGIKPARYLAEAHHVSIKQALRQIGEPALKSVSEEITNLIEYKVFHPVDHRKLSPAERKSAIRSSMFLKEKFKPDGSFDKFKTRVTAGGNQQDRSVYSDSETAAPTVATPNLYTVAAVAAKENRKVGTLDVKCAYLNAEKTGKKVLMYLNPLVSDFVVALKPEWKHFRLSDGSMVVELDKALYGCIESANLWYHHLRGTLEQLGFKPTRIDPCVFVKNDKSGQCTVCTHVDDLFITSQSDSLMRELVEGMKKTYGDVTFHEGLKHDYLGCTFDFTQKGKCTIDMRGYVDGILTDFHVNGGSKVPCTMQLLEIDETSPALDEEKRKRFHSAVAKLLYLSVRTRPDLQVTVSFLSTRVQQPSQQDEEKMEKALKYLNSTKHLNLTLEPGEELKITTSIDASHGIHVDGKGHTGGTYSLGKGAIHARSTKQRIVSKSSAESELIAVSDYMSNPLQAREFLRELGYEVPPVEVQQDNQSTIKLIEKGRAGTERTRHIAIRYFFIKDRVDAGEARVNYTPTEDVTADILTKPMTGWRFRRHRHVLLNLPGILQRGGVSESRDSE
jgi:hypothetical protein